jgi:glycosyltransferase involved in cell wall biosynthesis
MDNKVAVLIPTLGRPHKLKENVDNLFSVTGRDEIDIVFIIEPDDEASLKAAEQLECLIVLNERTKNYAGAINTAVNVLDHRYFYAAADDFNFHPNWLPPLLEKSKQYGIVGSDDLGNPNVKAGNFAVSYLVSRWYIPYACIGYPDCLVYEGYKHNYTDTELSQTAIHRGQYYFCAESVVEHMHPAWGKAGFDKTYERSLDQSLMDIDDAEFRRRSGLWWAHDVRVETPDEW